MILAESTGLFDLSPDGKTLLVSTYDFKLRRPNITLFDVESKKSIRVLDYDPRHASRIRFSPDGKMMVYALREKGVDNLWGLSFERRSGKTIDPLHFIADSRLQVVARRKDPGPDPWRSPH